MEIINFEKDRIENIEIEDGSITLYFLNGDTKGKTYPYSALSVSEKLFVADFLETKIIEKRECKICKMNATGFGEKKDLCFGCFITSIQNG